MRSISSKPSFTAIGTTRSFPGAENNDQVIFTLILRHRRKEADERSASRSLRRCEPTLHPGNVFRFAAARPNPEEQPVVSTVLGIISGLSSLPILSLGQPIRMIYQ